MSDNTVLDQNDSVHEAIEALSKLLVMMRLSTYIMAVYAMIQGILVIIGGPDRFSALGYRTAMIVPGAPASWGWVLLAFGIISFVGIKNRMYRVGYLGMFGAGTWSFCFGGAFLISAVQYPEANLTAVATYGKDGVIFVLMAMAQWTLSHAHTKPEDYNA